jgi:hypothetical protein
MSVTVIRLSQIARFPVLSGLHLLLEIVPPVSDPKIIL